MNITLASKSPRRKELLIREGIKFSVVSPDFTEPANFGLTPEKYVEFLAYNKAKSVLEKIGGIVIGADTVVVLDGKILGKPVDEADAEVMLRSLSGKTHKVITGYAIISSDKEVVSSQTTHVTFNCLNEKFIKDYVLTKSPLDKAGAYGIQDNDCLVKDINGDYDNVVGLPVKLIKNILSEFV